MLLRPRHWIATQKSVSPKEVLRETLRPRAPGLKTETERKKVRQDGLLGAARAVATELRALLDPLRGLQTAADRLAILGNLEFPKAQKVHTARKVPESPSPRNSKSPRSSRGDGRKGKARQHRKKIGDKKKHKNQDGLMLAAAEKKKAPQNPPAP